jgi:23S rRNA (uracil1939-C5)-methyltransferase
VRHRPTHRKKRPRPAAPTSPPGPTLESVRIDSLAYGGRGLARANGRLLSIAGTAPGDVVDCRPRPDSTRHEADLIRVVSPGPDRRVPPCPYWEACGSCQLMQLEYPAQLEAKRRFVADALGRSSSVDPVRASARQDGYRRRTTVRGTFGGGRVELGLLRQGSRELVDLPSCMVLHPTLSEALDLVRRRLGELPAELSGEVKVEASCDVKGRVGLVLVVARAVCEPFEGVCDALVADGVAAVRLVDDADRTWLEEGDPRQFFVRAPEAGAGGCRFSLGSFTQLNFEQNDALVTHVVEAVREVSPATVLDLYAGIGNYSLALARHVGEVLSVESSLSAVADLRNNALEQGLANVRCVRGASSQVLRALLQRRDRFDAVVLNPTRAGADGVVQPLTKLAPRRIVYVSCSPPTLARDMAVLMRGGYRVTRVTPFDMFPQTYHVETVAVMDRERR